MALRGAFSDNNCQLLTIRPSQSFVAPHNKTIEDQVSPLTDLPMPLIELNHFSSFVLLSLSNLSSLVSMLQFLASVTFNFSTKALKCMDFKAFLCTEMTV